MHRDRPLFPSDDDDDCSFCPPRMEAVLLVLEQLIRACDGWFKYHPANCDCLWCYYVEGLDFSIRGVHAFLDSDTRETVALARQRGESTEGRLTAAESVILARQYRALARRLPRRTDPSYPSKRLALFNRIESSIVNGRKQNAA